MIIRPFKESDWNEVWAILEPVFREGESFPQSTDITEEQAYRSWIEMQGHTYVAEDDGHILGTYTLKPNQQGLGSHVCNCGYIVSANARRRGVATAMCRHSQEEARRLGYRAMQYNLVVSTNERAVKLWTSLGFTTIGRLPGAFKSTRHGYVDALVMYKTL
jgi:ribosomal protein S18 acetylase RimI-like enzyme